MSDVQYRALVERIVERDAEIERLRAIAFDAEEYARTVRKTTIEQCARLCEDRRWGIHTPLEEIAAAIRALKDAET